MTTKLSVEEVVEAIGQLDSEERRELLTALPAVLRLSPDDYGWLKVVDSSFAFWDNDDDAVYDTL